MKSDLGIQGLALRLSAAVLALSLPAVAQFSFNTPVSYPSGSDPHDVAVGDFDADGDLDLVSTLHTPPRLSVLKGNGDGTYGAPLYTNLSAGVVPQGVLAPDLDADGLADVVVVSSATGELIVMHNLGNANFSQIAALSVGIGPTELVTADFDRDGDIDIAISNTTGSTVAIVHNLGNGQFQRVQDVAVGSGPKALDVGRFFGVNAPSIAVAVHDSHAVYMLKNDGSGLFNVQLILTVPNATHPECVAVADFDEDGDDDVAATFSEGNLNKFALFYQYPAGGGGNLYNWFSAPFRFNVGAVHPTHIVAGDFDLDTRIDVAIVSSNSAMLSMLRNLGGNAFGFQIMMNLPGPASDHMQVADLDKDYNPDLVCTNDGGSSLSVILNARTNPSSYCLSVPNSTGVGANVSMLGSASISTNNLTLRVTNAPPNKLGMFLYGQKPTMTPFNGAYLCVQPPIRRLDPIVQIDANGVASYLLPLTINGLVGHRPLFVDPGSIWNFQFLYRDSRGGTWPRTNTSDGLRIVFEP